MATLFDLNEGDLFIADVQPNEVFRLIKSPNDAGTALVRCALCRDGEGHWHPATRDSDENFNGYAEARKANISIDVE